MTDPDSSVSSVEQEADNLIQRWALHACYFISSRYSTDAGFRAQLDESYGELAVAMAASNRRQVCDMLVEMEARRRETRERQRRTQIIDPFAPETQRALEAYAR